MIQFETLHSKYFYIFKRNNKHCVNIINYLPYWTHNKAIFKTDMFAGTVGY